MSLPVYSWCCMQYYKGAFYDILYFFREVAQNGLWFGFDSSDRIRKAAALLNEDRLTAALQEVLADKEKRIKAQEVCYTEPICVLLTCVMCMLACQLSSNIYHLLEAIIACPKSDDCNICFPVMNEG